MDRHSTASGTTDSSTTIGMLANAIVSRRLLVAAVTAISLVACLAVALLATPQYSATTILAPPASPIESAGVGRLAGQFGGLADMAGIELGGRQDVDQTLAILQSEEFLQRFIETEGVPQIFFAEQWDPINKRWLPDRSPRARFFRSVAGWFSPDQKQSGPGSSFPDSWTVFRRFVSLVSVLKDKRTQIVTLSVRWKDPNIAARWANSLVRHLNEEARVHAVAEADASLGYLAEQLQRTQVLGVREALYRLVESEQQRAMIASTRHELALRVLASAQVPRERVFPKRKLLVIAGLIGGFIIGVFAALTPSLAGEALGPRRR